MDNQTFFTMVGRMDGTLIQLDKNVTILTAEVKRLQKRQNYWSGALAAVGILCSGIGAAAALVCQWLLTK